MKLRAISSFWMSGRSERLNYVVPDMSGASLAKVKKFFIYPTASLVSLVLTPVDFTRIMRWWQNIPKLSVGVSLLTALRLAAHYFTKVNRIFWLGSDRVQGSRYHIIPLNTIVYQNCLLIRSIKWDTGKLRDTFMNTIVVGNTFLSRNC